VEVIGEVEVEEAVAVETWRGRICKLQDQVWREVLSWFG